VKKTLNYETDTFLGEKLPGMLDYMIWPWIERLPVINSFVSKELFSLDVEMEANPKLVRNHFNQYTIHNPCVQ
jgi:hypothetical protein